jgi:tRNA-Thr(GGU) m(6)t(6)A37 methyltransferase TsaA
MNMKREGITMEMILKPIGIIHSPFAESSGTPIQPSAAFGATGAVEVFPEYEAGLADIGGFERTWLIYWFDRAREPKLKVIPYLDDAEHGLFSTRAPSRPNPVGISSVRLLSVEGTVLKVGDIDILDGTPLIDIKPYVPAFDVYPVIRTGWIGAKNAGSVSADDRFEQQ